MLSKTLILLQASEKLKTYVEWQKFTASSKNVKRLDEGDWPGPKIETHLGKLNLYSGPCSSETATHKSVHLTISIVEATLVYYNVQSIV